MADDYDEPADITTDEDRLADEFAGLAQDEAALADWVWPPKSRRLIKQKCPECSGPVDRVWAEWAVYDWCRACDAEVE